MALDRIQPLKIEGTDTGGDSNDRFPTALEPQHDYVECAGVVIDDASNRDEKTVIDRSGNDLRFKDGNNTTPVTLSQLASGVSPGYYVRVATGDTITAQHSFSPGTTQAPFTLGANAQGELVTGLNADKLDGSDSSAFQPADATLTALAALSTSANNLILVTGSDTFSVGQLSDTYVDSLSQSKTHGSADTDVGATSLHHTLGTGQYQAAAGNHTHAVAYTTATGLPLGFVNRTSSQLSWNNTNKSLSLAVKSPATEYVFYESGGTAYTKTTTQTATLSSPAAGKWYFYFSSGTLTYASSFPSSGWATTFVAVVWLDASNNIIYLGDERHGTKMDPDTHELMHDTVGLRWESGLSPARIASGTGGADGDAQIYMTDGKVHDEDIECSIVRSATPANDFEQELGVSGTPGQFPIYYRSGSGSNNWLKRTATNYPIFQNSAGERIVYNLDTGGTWSTAQIGSNNNFGIVYLVATTSITEPVLAVLGQADYATQAAASLATFADLALGNLPFQEMKPICKLIYKTSTSYGNTVKSYVVSITDLRNTQQLPSGNYIASDHNALTGRDATASHPATALVTDTTNFNGILTTSETDAQKALDKLDDGAQPKDATLTALAGLSTSAGNLILVTGEDTFSVGQLSDTYVSGLSQSKTHGSADTDVATTSLHHTIGTNATQAAAGDHSHSGLSGFTTQQPLDGSISVYNAASGVTCLSRIMPGDPYDLFWLPCDDYGIGGANQIRAIVNGYQQTITMTAGGVARQTFSGLFTRSMARCSKTALGLAFTLGVTEWSMSAWVYPFLAGTATTTNKLLTLKDNNNNQHGLALITPSASDYFAWYPQIYIQGTAYGTWTYNTDRDAMLPQHEWSLVSATYDKTSGVYRIYRNGILVASGTQSTTGTSFNNGIDTISPGDYCAVCDMRIASIRRDESYYLAMYQRGMSRFDFIPYKNTENWSAMTTENPISTIWG